jgi:hypothetical protein
MPLEAIGKGMVKLTSYIGKTKVSFKLKDVFYVPKVSHNLISVSRLDQEGGHVDLKDGMMKLFSKDGRQFAQACLQKGLYVLNARAKLQPLTETNVNVAQDNKGNSWAEWHRKYRHVSYSGFKRLHSEGLVDGMTAINETSQMPECEACIQAKQLKHTHRSHMELQTTTN